MNKRLVAACGGLLLALGPAGAADMIGGYADYSCPIAGASLVSSESDASLREDVARRMNEAIAVSHDERWIHSTRPVFRWAQQATYACGKAYGYLKSSYRDEQNLENCGCAYSRMVGYMR